MPNQFTWVKSIDAVSSDEDVVLDFFKESLKEKCEGIMVKVLDNLPELAIPDGEAVDPAAITTGSSQSKGNKSKRKKDPKNPAPTSGGRRKALLSTYEPDKRLEVTPCLHPPSRPNPLPELAQSQKRLRLLRRLTRPNPHRRLARLRPQIILVVPHPPRRPQPRNRLPPSSLQMHVRLYRLLLPRATH